MVSAERVPTDLKSCDISPLRIARLDKDPQTQCISKECLLYPRGACSRKSAMLTPGAMLTRSMSMPHSGPTSPALEAQGKSLNMVTQVKTTLPTVLGLEAQILSPLRGAQRVMIGWASAANRFSFLRQKDMLTSDETQTISWLDSRQDEMLKLIVELCDINSGTQNLPGIKQVLDRLIGCFESLDGELNVVPAEPWESVDEQGQVEMRTSGAILHVHKWPEAPRKVMLCIHMDTVYGANHPFQKCRTMEDGTVNGPGVIDAKGGIVLLLYALKALEQGPLAGKVGWEVILNADEEIGSPGSDTFIRQRAPHCDAGMLFEPSLPDGTLVSWRKGSGNFTFVVKGKSAHTGRDFQSGRNALAALSRMMVEIDDWNTDPEVTFNVGRIRGGTALNMVPDLAVGHGIGQTLFRARRNFG